MLVCAQDFLRNYGSKESLGTTPLPTANELFQALKETQLLFEFELGDCEKRYRTRMAETLRLIVRLKQLFKEEGWEHRPDLVSDYRLMVRPRAFPKRTIAPTSIQSDQLTAIQNALLACLTAQNWDLARFQQQSTERILAKAERDTGTIVCAGTGSGKTLAFYLPAYLKAIDSIAQAKPDTQEVRLVSIYPRNELLKDQASNAVKDIYQWVNPVLAQNGKRNMTVGVLYGDTPVNAAKLKQNKKGRKGRGARINQVVMYVPILGAPSLCWTAEPTS